MLSRRVGLGRGSRTINISVRSLSEHTTLWAMVVKRRVGEASRAAVPSSPAHTVGSVPDARLYALDRDTDNFIHGAPLIYPY